MGDAKPVRGGSTRVSRARIIFVALAVLFAATSASASCDSARALFSQGLNIGEVAAVLGVSAADVAACFNQGSAVIVPRGAVGGAPHGAAGPAPHGAAGPAPHGAAGPAPHGAAGPAPHGAAGPPPSSGFKR